jgi:hypothetical protein
VPLPSGGHVEISANCAGHAPGLAPHVPLPEHTCPDTVTLVSPQLLLSAQSQKTNWSDFEQLHDWFALDCWPVWQFLQAVSQFVQSAPLFVQVLEANAIDTSPLAMIIAIALWIVFSFMTYFPFMVLFGFDYSFSSPVCSS